MGEMRFDGGGNEGKGVVALLATAPDYRQRMFVAGDIGHINANLAVVVARLPVARRAVPCRLAVTITAAVDASQHTGRTEPRQQAPSIHHQRSCRPFSRG